MKKTTTDEATRLLEGAYAIRTASDSIEYYREFANCYDDEYANRMGYIYPAMLSSVYSQYAGSNDNPIADIGCGTGLVAEALQQLTTGHSKSLTLIDGIDISPEMLVAAEAKDLYRSLYKVDLTKGIDALPKDYGAIVSAGTFTFGHLGPQVLRDLIALGKSDTLYCIGVNSIYFEEQGFSRVLTSMVEDGLIHEPVLEVRKIYDQPEDNSDNHANDTATVLVYRQC